MKKLNRYAPPGTDVKRELIIYTIFGFILIFCFSLGFIFSYFNELNSLYTYEYGSRVLIEGAKIQDINSMMRFKFAGFWGFAVFCIAMAIGHYSSFSHESKSIYVMKRLSDAKKLHVYCLTLPVMALLAGSILTVLLILIYTQIYLHVTPAECLPVFSRLNIWRAFL